MFMVNLYHLRLEIQALFFKRCITIILAQKLYNNAIPAPFSRAAGEMAKFVFF